MSAHTVKREKIFFSYTIRDGILDTIFFQHMCSMLKIKYDVFVDLIHNDSAEKQQRVVEELKSSQYVVVLNTPLINESDWVKFEIEEARLLSKIIYSVDLRTKEKKDVFLKSLKKDVSIILNGEMK